MTDTNRPLPKIVSSEKVFQGRVFNITVDTIQEGDVTYQREVVRHHGSAVILPVFSDGTIAFVRQYRHPALRYLLELPAGTLEVGERPEIGAARELEEELGYVAGRMEKLAEFFVSPGFLEEKMWLFLATDLVQTQQRLEADEILDVVRVPFSEALLMIADGEIEDAKTVIGLTLAAPKIRASINGAEYPAV